MFLMDISPKGAECANLQNECNIGTTGPPSASMAIDREGDFDHQTQLREHRDDCHIAASPKMHASS
jgi:hypothetical protein